MEFILKSIESKLDRLIAIFEATPSVRSAAAPRQAARTKVLADHDSKWNRVKEDWPGFRVHPKSCEAFERHCASLGGEPPTDKIGRLRGKLKPGKYYKRTDLEQQFHFKYEIAQAYLYFLKISGLIWISGKGLKTEEMK